MYCLEVMIEWEQIFDIVPDTDKNGKTIYRLRFKNTNEVMKVYMATREGTVANYARKWVKKNQQQAQDIVFEIEVLKHE